VAPTTPVELVLMGNPVDKNNTSDGTRIKRHISAVTFHQKVPYFLKEAGIN
jgi:hypothetical protein